MAGDEHACHIQFDINKYQVYKIGRKINVMNGVKLSVAIKNNLISIYVRYVSKKKTKTNAMKLLDWGDSVTNRPTEELENL